MAYDFDDFLFRNQSERYNNYHTTNINYNYKHLYPQHDDEYNIDQSYYDYYENFDNDHIYKNYDHWVSPRVRRWDCKYNPFTNSIQITCKYVYKKRWGYYLKNPWDASQKKYTEDSFRNRIDYVYAHYSRWIQFYSKYGPTGKVESKYKPTYQQYLKDVPEYMQFSYNINALKSEIKDVLENIIHKKGIIPSMKNDEEKCKIIRSLLNETIDSSKYFNRAACDYIFTNYEGIICGDCDRCLQQLQRGPLLQLITYFCICDIKPMIYEIMNEIKQEQIEKIDNIYEYHQTNSKQVYNEQLVDLINIDGISFAVCDIILDYISNEYPYIDYNQYEDNKLIRVNNNEYFRHKYDSGFRFIDHLTGDLSSKYRLSKANELRARWINEEWKCIRLQLSYHGSGCKKQNECQQWLIDNNFPNIGGLQYLNVFCDTRDANGTDHCIGQIEYDQGRVAYFYCEAYRNVKIIFSKKWLDLYDLIENNTLKINCYSFLFE